LRSLAHSCERFPAGERSSAGAKYLKSRIRNLRSGNVLRWRHSHDRVKGARKMTLVTEAKLVCDLDEAEPVFGEQLPRTLYALSFHLLMW
jgi:hypothetical protein